MGTSCTRVKKISVPSRVIHVEQRSRLDQNEGIIESERKEDVLFPDMTTPRQTHPQREKQDNPVLVDQQTQMTPIKLNEKNDKPEDVVDCKRILSIGEHYLSSEGARAKQPSPKQSRAFKLSKKPPAKSEQIDHIINKIERTLGRMRMKELTKGLYSVKDICLQQYSKEQPAKFNKFYAEGLPMKHRWNFWKARLQPNQYYIEGLYERFLLLSSSSTVAIQKDIHRTFPEEAYFSAEEYGRVGQSQLSNVLKALSIYFPNPGYCQGMNFIVAFFLLINGGNELEAFWMFVALARHPDFLIIGFFETNFPLLDFYIFIFYELFSQEMPLLHQHVKSLAIPDSLWITKWILTLFLYSLPAKKVVRIWDFIMGEELFGVLKVALAVLKIYEKEMVKLDIMGCNDLFRFLQHEKPVRDPRVSQDESSFVFSSKEVDIEILLKTAKKFQLSKHQIAQYCRKFVEKAAKVPSHPYYKFYSDYEANSKNESIISEFQRDIDWRIAQQHLIDEPKAFTKGVSIIKEVEANILQDLEIEDIENSATKREHIDKSKEADEEDELENDVADEMRDGVVDLSTVKRVEESEESKTEALAENPLTLLALKDQGNFETISWAERSSYKGSQAGSGVRQGTDDFPSEIDEMKGDEKLRDEHLGEIQSAGLITTQEKVVQQPRMKRLNNTAGSQRFLGIGCAQEVPKRPTLTNSIANHNLRKYQLG